MPHEAKDAARASMPNLEVRKLGGPTRAHIALVREVFQVSRAAGMPWLPVLHTGEEDLAFFGENLDHAWQGIGLFDGETLAGFVAYDAEWIHQLWVHPDYWRQGLGRRLMQLATPSPGRKRLYVFAENHRARAFYESVGFKPIAFERNNEEQLPNVLYERTDAGG